jgi:aminopeptidase
VNPSETNFKKYAQLIVKTGLNLQKEQILVINSPIECAPFARLVAEAAYAAGARDVVMNWKDELFAKIRFLHAKEEVFADFPAWQKEFHMFYLNQGAAFLSIAASDPEIFKDVDLHKIVTAQKSSNTALKEYRERLMSNETAWCVVAIPTAAWAAKIFPGNSAAVAKLWDAIFQSVRVYEPDPVAAWAEHKQKQKKWLDFLNSNHFTALKFKNAQGTDLSVKLPAKHLWLAGAEHTKNGVEFIANMPTEEVFTLPEKTGVNGTVKSSKPLNYNGNLIKDFSLTFENGKIAAFSAQAGYEVLKKLIETDEGAAYLGEVALVPYDSPISNLDILFYNTLFDENASCHLALGKAYNVCLQDGASKTKEELAAMGANDSLVHVDFMIGTSDLRITGLRANGEEKNIFVNGNFSI